MKLRFLAACLILAGCTAAPAQPPSRPRLIVAISIDQFSADLFAQYRRHFTGGLARLQEGVVFPSGYQSHAATETCPGHSTILTGARPARSGIVANDWIDQNISRADKTVYCVEDERIPGTTSRDYRVSPLHLRVPTLGDLMRNATAGSRVVAVAGKDRAAMMLGGRNPTLRWYRRGTVFENETGAAPSPAVTAANAAFAAALAGPRAPFPLPDLCSARARPVTIEGTDRIVGAGRLGRAAGNGDAFIASPDFDQLVLNLAQGLADEQRLGRREETDLLAIGLSATDYVGHGFGPGGPEMCIQLLALDRMLGAFFAHLDAQGIDYAVVLTADHGGLDIPERARENGMPDAQRVSDRLNAETIGGQIGTELGLSGNVLHGGSFGDVWLDRGLSEADRRRVGEAALRLYRANAQVFAVYTRAEIAAAPLPSGPPDSWTILQEIRASFDPARSGDFYVVLRPGVTPIAAGRRGGAVATHGSVWDYDRRVPILFWRRGMTGFEQPLAVETVDIMPTLAGLLRLRIEPATIDGRCLDLVAGPETSCR